MILHNYPCFLFLSFKYLCGIDFSLELSNKMKRQKQNLTPAGRFLKLSDAEKTREAAEFDREFAADTFRPLTPTQRKRWNRIKRKMGRPRIGRGAKVISLTIEKGLLNRTDALARKQKLTRAALIARALETVLSAAG